MITMLSLLVRTAAPFEQQLWKTLPIEADRELYRARVENALFLQLQIGPKPEKAEFNGYLLASIAFFTIVLRRWRRSSLCRCSSCPTTA